VRITDDGRAWLAENTRPESDTTTSNAADEPARASVESANKCAVGNDPTHPDIDFNSKTDPWRETRWFVQKTEKSGYPLKSGTIGKARSDGRLKEGTDWHRVSKNKVLNRVRSLQRQWPSACIPLGDDV
jgi:hypothetical protein